MVEPLSMLIASAAGQAAKRTSNPVAAAIIHRRMNRPCKRIANILIRGASSGAHVP
jgi:hypothetical protein